MAYWLVKSEPGVYSWDQLVKDKRTRWDGIRNYAARNHLQAMQKADQVFFYHSNEGLNIVGIAEVVRTHYPDPGTDNPAWVAVDIKPVRPLRRPVSMAEIKQNAALKNMALLRISRLSVQPVTEQEWQEILHMAGE